MNTSSDIADIGMIPFLAITGAPTEAECRAKVAAIEKDGARSFLLYARSGLALNYMGEEWLQLAEWFCDEASRRGLKVWLYDEFNWPSGTCRGRVPRENDAWRYREVGVFPREGGGWLWQEALAPAGWVNVCEPDAVRRFIELTHEVYAKRLARFFTDGTVVGFFTDEPGHPVGISFEAGKPVVSFRVWSDLKDEYRAETGRDFRADVEAWLENGGRTVGASLLALYSRLLGRRFRTAFFDQIRAWCEAHGVALTGHMIAENSLADSCRFNGDPMLCLRGETIPGMDEIGSAFDPDGKASHSVEWVTFNMARQAILHNGRGGCAELFACGPGDLPPAALRQIVWMCAFHGIDRYVTCMDVMDERGFVEKHCYISAAGPVHPWYERHAGVFAEECQRAAEFAAKRVSGREVGVRYPDRAAAAATFGFRDDGPSSADSAKAPDAYGLLGALETHQFVPRFVREEEPCDLPLVFVCRPDGKYDEEKTKTTGINAEEAVSLCRRQFSPPSKKGVTPTGPVGVLRILDAEGEAEADALMVRTCEDGTSAVINMRPFATRQLVAERGGERCGFILPPHGVQVFAPGPFMTMTSNGQQQEARSLASAQWTLCRDRPNLFRVNFTENGGRRGTVNFVHGAKACPILRDCAISYAVTPSGRPIGTGEDAPVGEKIIRHDAAPYAFALDGAPLAVEHPGENAGALPAVFAPLYRRAAQHRFTAGTHTFEIVSGEPDTNYFLPALWLAGDFRVLGGAVFTEADAPVGFGSFADLGYPHYVGCLTWRATLTVPSGGRWRLRIDTGGTLASVRFHGVDLGVRAWAPFEWEIPENLAGQTGELEIAVYSSAQPMFGRHGVAGAVWDQHLWYGDHALGARCGLFSAEWILRA